MESGFCKSFEDAKKHAKYCMSKFARALLMDNKFTFDNTQSAWKSVPIQNYSEDFWNSDSIDDIDEGLFNKYNVPEELRKFVREKIQPKTTADILGYDGKEIDFSKVKEEEVEPESLPKSIYDLDPKRLSPNPDIPKEEKYKSEDLKAAYPDWFERFENEPNPYGHSFRYWLYQKVDDNNDEESED